MNIERVFKGFYNRLERLTTYKCKVCHSRAKEIWSNNNKETISRGEVLSRREREHGRGAFQRVENGGGNNKKRDHETRNTSFLLHTTCCSCYFCFFCYLTGMPPINSCFQNRIRVDGFGHKCIFLLIEFSQASLFFHAGFWIVLETR